MEARYGRAERTLEDAAWAHKYVMILDGNTFSSRLVRTLRSGLLFSEWFDNRLQPFVHHLPVCLLRTSLLEQHVLGLFLHYLLVRLPCPPPLRSAACPVRDHD